MHVVFKNAQRVYKILYYIVDMYITTTTSDIIYGLNNRVDSIYLIYINLMKMLNTLYDCYIWTRGTTKTIKCRSLVSPL